MAANAARRPKAVQQIFNDVEKARTDENWALVPDLLQRYSRLAPESAYFDVVHVDMYLEEYRRSSAKDAKLLERCVEHSAKALAAPADDVSPDEANILAAQLKYRSGSHSDALESLTKINLYGIVDSMDASAGRIVRLALDALALKGLISERMALAPAECVRPYEHVISATTTLFPNGTTSQTVRRAVDLAHQRIPAIFSKSRDLGRCVEALRRTLLAGTTYVSESTVSRARQSLSKVLLSASTEDNYLSTPSRPAPPKSPKSHSRSASLGTSKSAQQMSGNAPTLGLPTGGLAGAAPTDGRAVSNDEIEESVLLLLLEESEALGSAVASIADRDVLSRFTSDITSIYDRLTIALARRSQFAACAEALDRSMRFSFECPYVWLQFGQALEANGEHKRAAMVFKQLCASKEGSGNILAHLYAAKIYLVSLNEPDTALELASAALELAQAERKRTASREGLDPSKVNVAGWPSPSNSAHLTARAAEYVGMSHARLASVARLEERRRSHLRQAIDNLHQAFALDPVCPRIAYHLALQYAHIREIGLAVAHVKKALEADRSFIPALHLLALLMSARRHDDVALRILDSALELSPGHMCIMALRAKLQERFESPAIALGTYRTMLKLWRDDPLMQEASSSRLLQRVTAEGTHGIARSPSGVNVNTLDDVNASETASVRPASSKNGLDTLIDTPAPEAMAGEVSSARAVTLCSLWLAVADVFTTLGQYTDAKMCLEEARILFPLSPEVYYQFGRLAAAKGDSKEAELEYAKALSLDPSHISSLVGAGTVFRIAGKPNVAELHLTEAAALDPTNHQVWYNLGLVLRDRDEPQKAVDCMLAAVDLESTAPVMPFASIPCIL
eukprot:Opistho-2@80319